MNGEDDGYPVPARRGEGEIRDKGSRFLARVLPAADSETARHALEEIRRLHPDATHHCWAWRLGAEPEERASDAGEPAGTAGVPILQVLRGAELSDVLAVVSRWFGGTKLGKGGLARAYAAATAQALDGLPTIRRVPTLDLDLDLPYDRLGAVKRLVHPPEVEILDERYTDHVHLTLRVHRPHLPTLRAALANLGVGVEEGG